MQADHLHLTGIVTSAELCVPIRQPMYCLHNGGKQTVGRLNVGAARDCFFPKRIETVREVLVVAEYCLNVGDQGIESRPDCASLD
ncbi:MAG TPA: hypothetical protein VGG64_25795 [Pirellulales bacterium]